MKHIRKSLSASAALLGVLVTAPAPASAQAIFFSQGVADLTFFYNTNAGTFDVVFRSKGTNTTASNLTSEYAGPSGGLGGPTGADRDWNFSSLTTLVRGNQTVAIGGTDFFVTTASGNGYTRVEDPSQADLGFRTRFRDSALIDAVSNPNGDQFASLGLTLNLLASTMPGEFALFRTDSLLNANTILINSDAEQFSATLSNWGHSHYHWGFSAPGNYTLVFDIVGLSGGETPVALTPTGSFSLDFQVIPEPAAFAGAFGAVALGFALMRRRRQAAAAAG